MLTLRSAVTNWKCFFKKLLSSNMEEFVSTGSLSITKIIRIMGRKEREQNLVKVQW
jgi:hypothetical protein